MKLQTILELPECRVLVEGRPEPVMGNRNTLAVASLTDTACVVLAEGTVLDEGTLSKAGEEGIAILATELPVFDIALKIHEAGDI